MRLFGIVAVSAMILGSAGSVLAACSGYETATKSQIIAQDNKGTPPSSKPVNQSSSEKQS